MGGQGTAQRVYIHARAYAPCGLGCAISRASRLGTRREISSGGAVGGIPGRGLRSEGRSRSDPQSGGGRSRHVGTRTLSAPTIADSSRARALLADAKKRRSALKTLCFGLPLQRKGCRIVPLCTGRSYLGEERVQVHETVTPARLEQAVHVVRRLWGVRGRSWFSFD